MKTIQPGGTLGVLGGGQLGRMFTIAAKQMGYNVVVFSPETDSPAGQVADNLIQANYDDDKALQKFADAIDCVTIEFENIPVEVLEQLEAFVPVRPGADVLRRTQNRLREKTFLSSNGFPLASFRPVASESDVQSVGSEAFPAVLKTCSSGYDGKGQRIVNSVEHLPEAWKDLGSVECVLESFVEFDCEFSVIVASNESAIQHYEPIRNSHRNHILDVSSSPANLPPQAAEAAVGVARGIAETLGYVGVLCVEFFLHRDGSVLVNEIAPRPHNSGHLTIEAHDTSQFEQQVRAVCNLPLGSTSQPAPAAMANLLGDLWVDGMPKWEEVLKSPGTGLHLYGKGEPRVGRKMGHLTCVRQTVESAIEDVTQSREACAPGLGFGQSDDDLQMAM